MDQYHLGNNIIVGPFYCSSPVCRLSAGCEGDNPSPVTFTFSLSENGGGWRGGGGEREGVERTTFLRDSDVDI